MTGVCDGRVAIVTGAGRGIGREHALELAHQGAKVVVNDIGVSLDGSHRAESPAHEVVETIRASGGEAIVNGDDVSDWAGARHLIDQTIGAFGALNILVNNAGILRDHVLVSMDEPDWDDVIRVHLKGTFATSHWAAAHWRARSKAGAEDFGRIINTTSPSGIYGNFGQSNYGAAKAGIAAFTIITAMELAKYGATVNAIAPSARTRMTENLATSRSAGPVQEGEFDFANPANIAPLVAWLASTESQDVTGRVFNVSGGHISVAEAWRAGPSVDQDRRWDPSELAPVVRDLLSRAQPNPDMFGGV